MKIQTYFIKTGCGRIMGDGLPFLSNKQTEEFNTIGYTGANSSGEKANFQDYLNSLNLGTFDMTKTKFDNGNCLEEYTVVRATTTSISGVIFGVSCDGGKTGVKWSYDVQECFDYLKLQGEPYCVVAVEEK